MAITKQIAMTRTTVTAIPINEAIMGLMERPVAAVAVGVVWVVCIDEVLGVAEGGGSDVLRTVETVGRVGIVGRVVGHGGYVGRSVEEYKVKCYHNIYSMSCSIS